MVDELGDTPDGEPETADSRRPSIPIFDLGDEAEDGGRRRPGPQPRNPAEIDPERERRERARSHLDEVEDFEGGDVPTDSGDPSIGTKTEAIANFRVEESGVGTNLLDRLAELSQAEAENAPIGKWEKLKYSIGYGGARAEKYQAAKSQRKELDRDREIWVKREQKFREEGRVLCQQIEELQEIVDDSDKTYREKRRASKKIIKLTGKSQKLRRYIDDGVLSSIRAKLGMGGTSESETERVKIPVTREIMHDYEEKAEEIASLENHLQTSEGFFGLIQKISAFGGTELEEDLGKFLAGKGSRPLRGLAESRVRTRLVQEKINQVRDLRTLDDWARFDPNDLAILLNELMKSKKSEGAYEREVVREYKGAMRIHQIKKYGALVYSMVEKVAKQQLARAVGSEEEVEGDESLREIIEQGENRIAQILAGARLAPEVVGLTAKSVNMPLQATENVAIAALEKLFRRSYTLDRRRISVDERRGEASRKRKDNLDVIRQVREAMHQISSRIDATTAEEGEEGR